MTTTYEFSCRNCAARYQAKEDWAGKMTDCKKCGQPIEIPYPPLELPKEVSAGGSVIHRHEQPINKEFDPAIGDSENIEKISDHIERWLGPVESVFHELVSDLVHIDVHFVKPTKERPWISLVTSGMSDRPMSPPEEYADLAYAELMINLPPDWPLDQDSLNDIANFWPIQTLKWLARFPHVHDTWIFQSHTIPNNHPPEAICDGVGFCCFLLFPTVLAPEEFGELVIDDKKTIHFFSIYPLYESEMNLKLEQGTDALIDLFDKYELVDIVDPQRPDLTRLN